MKYLLIAITVVMSSCEYTQERIKAEKSSNVKETYLEKNTTIVEVHGCEYIWYHEGYAGGLTHKGNCKNH